MRSPPPAAPAPSLDVPANHPYHEAIQDLGERGIIRGIIQGFASGTFGVDLPVMRRQFAKMVVLTRSFTWPPDRPT